MAIKLIILALLIGVIAWARKSSPASNKAGSQLTHANHTGAPKRDEADTELDFINVATFNIQTGKSEDGKRDIQASAHVLKDVDLAGVQEVYGPSFLNLLGLGQEQTRAIAAPGGFAYLFCATRRRWFKEHRGNALLSKLTVRNWRVEMLPDYSGKSFRNMSVAEIDWQGESFCFINTHLHTKKGREEQLDIVLREFAKHPRAILVGDFNSRADTPLLAQALRDIDITDAISAAQLDDNPDRIDWILTKGFKVDGGSMLEKGVSDHPYYQVKLSYNDQ